MNPKWAEIQETLKNKMIEFDTFVATLTKDETGIVFESKEQAIQYNTFETDIQNLHNQLKDLDAQLSGSKGVEGEQGHNKELQTLNNFMINNIEKSIILKLQFEGREWGVELPLNKFEELANVGVDILEKAVKTTFNQLVNHVENERLEDSEKKESKDEVTNE